jgi:N-acylneuraminate cytidylyltransferase
MRLAIIPARGGSKRIPRKNIKEFQGKPIIAYAIEAALASKCFDMVLVSTDDEEIKNFARANGAYTHPRSELNASDTAGTVPVLLEALDWQHKTFSIQTDEICCIYPCNPFLTAWGLWYAYTRHKKTNADSTFPVVKYSYPPQRALKITKCKAEMLHPEHYPTRSQDLEPIYHDAGQFYWLNTKALLEQQKLFMKRSTPLIYNELEAQDIDTLEDWALAEVKYQLWRNTQFSSLAQEPKGLSTTPQTA